MVRVGCKVCFIIFFRLSFFKLEILMCEICSRLFYEDFVIITINNNSSPFPAFPCAFVCPIACLRYVDMEALCGVIKF